jgi:hypothetical protein
MFIWEKRKTNTFDPNFIKEENKYIWSQFYYRNDRRNMFNLHKEVINTLNPNLCYYFFFFINFFFVSLLNNMRCEMVVRFVDTIN